METENTENVEKIERTRRVKTNIKVDRINPELERIYSKAKKHKIIERVMHYPDNIIKTKFILESEYSNGVIKRNMLGIYKSGHGWIVNRFKTFGQEVPKIGK